MAVELHGEVLDIRPGDTLLLTSSGPLSMEHEARMRDALEERLPGVTVVIVGPVSGAVVYRPDQVEVVHRFDLPPAPNVATEVARDMARASLRGPGLEG